MRYNYMTKTQNLITCKEPLYKDYTSGDRQLCPFAGKKCHVRLFLLLRNFLVIVFEGGSIMFELCLILLL